ncbi:macronuclear histone H4, partial [Peziza echinospora]
GKGKGGKGVSKAWQMRRYINRYHPNTNAFTRPALRRLCRRGGVKRISHASYSDQARTVAYDHVRSLVKDAVTYADHAGRKTVMAMDVVMAVKRQGGGLWGFG